MFIQRIASSTLRKTARQFPVVALTGPRQSGKTTLVQKTFPGKSYISLENIDAREFAEGDPRGFLAHYPKGAILDEVQRAPGLFSYIQGIVDRKKISGQFILTGSQNFLLHERITQSLAGRVAFVTLLPLSMEEVSARGALASDYSTYLFTGLYPRLYEAAVEPRAWYGNYIQTYIERDVRQIKNITDLGTFQLFLKMCAGRTGQLLNLSSLANDCGITHNTAKSWISILESSFVVFLLRPHHVSFNKRLVKMPKLYFIDPGIACSLLGIEDKRQLESHPSRGSLFESLIITEMMKYRLNRGRSSQLYFWRDKTGHEIDCLLEMGRRILPVEIKSGKTIVDDYFRDIRYWNELAKHSKGDASVVYGGLENQRRSDGTVLSWQQSADIFSQRVQR